MSAYDPKRTLNAPFYNICLGSNGKDRVDIIFANILSDFDLLEPQPVQTTLEHQKMGGL